MVTEPAIWSARLHHFRLNSPRADELVRFHEGALGLEAERVGERLWYLRGASRRLLIGEGAAETVPYIAFSAGTPERLERIEGALRATGLNLREPSTPLFEPGAVAVADPDGLELVFGLPSHADDGTDVLPGRLQHIVFASTAPDASLAFYRDRLGFTLSDSVLDENGALTAAFLRSDEEHHSYAVFRADQARFDHFSLEAECWNDLRDWADHFADLNVPIWWGPGRHGPGNNLFFMVRDPDGNRIEISAELELMPHAMAPRTWPHEERTLNLWGAGWLRS